MKAESAEGVESIIDTLWGLGQNIILQEFIAESAGRDLRAIVIGGELVATMRRTAKKGEFRSNLHRGGDGAARRAAGGLRARRARRRAHHGARRRRRRHAGVARTGRGSSRSTARPGCAASSAPPASTWRSASSRTPSGWCSGGARDERERTWCRRARAASCSWRATWRRTSCAASGRGPSCGRGRRAARAIRRWRRRSASCAIG